MITENYFINWIIITINKNHNKINKKLCQLQNNVPLKIYKIAIKAVVTPQHKNKQVHIGFLNGKRWNRKLNTIFYP